jgi:hypothetical protein
MPGRKNNLQSGAAEHHFKNMAKLLYVGHCVHTGIDLDYRYALTLDDTFHDLPNFYGISLVSVDGEKKEVKATVLVKTDMGNSKDEIGEMYGAVVGQMADLQKLPQKNVTLRCAKIANANGAIPTETDIVRLCHEAYTLNSMTGSA